MLRNTQFLVNPSTVVPVYCRLSQRLQQFMKSRTIKKS